MSSQATEGLDNIPFLGSEPFYGTDSHFAAIYWALLSRNQK